MPLWQKGLIAADVIVAALLILWALGVCGVLKKKKIKVVSE